MSASYWMRLEKDFMKKYYISEMRHRKNGNAIFALYMTMLTESIDHDGQLRSADGIPFSKESLMMLAFRDCILFSDSVQAAKDIQQFNSVVSDGLDFFSKYGLTKIADDGTIIMTKLEDCIGTTSTERSRKCREKKKQSQMSSATIIQENATNLQRNATLQNASCNGNVQQKCNEDKIKDKIKIKDINKKVSNDTEKGNGDTALSVAKIDYFKDFSGDDETLYQTLIFFNEMRNKMRKPMTDHAKDLLCRRLTTLRENGQDIIACINQSIKVGWTDVYELKNDYQANGKQAETAEQIIERRANAVGQKNGSGY